MTDKKTRSSGIRDAHRRNRELAEERRAVLRPIVLSLHQQGSNLEKIAAEMTARGYPTARGKRWHRTTVSRLLKPTTLEGNRDG